VTTGGPITTGGKGSPKLKETHAEAVPALKKKTTNNMPNNRIFFIYLYLPFLIIIHKT